MDLIQDLFYAFRTLRKSLEFTLPTILALGLGIGVNSAMFSIIDQVLLRPLPFPRADRLMNVWETNWKRNIPNFSAAPANYYDWRSKTTSFSVMGAYQQNTFNLSTTEGEPERYLGALCDHGFFSALEVSPILGRTFTEDEERDGNDGVAVLSYGLWQRRFGGDSNIVGKKIILDSRVRIITGVMPKDFQYPPQATIWVPFGFDDQAKARRDLHRLRVIGRLKNNVTLDHAAKEFQALGADMAKEYPTANKDAGIVLHPMLDDLVGQMRPALYILLGAVIFVLLIACANVANLLLVRSASRIQEMAIRSSLGARRSSILRLVFTESIVLAVAGGVAGTALAYAILHGMLVLAPANLPRLAEVSLDWRAAAFTLAISLATGILFGFAPARNAVRSDMAHLLREGSKTAGKRSSVLRSVLVAGQVAIALFLLVGAGLLIRSFYEVEHSNAGFDPEHVASLRLSPASAKYRGHDDLLIQLAQSIIQNVSALPGVKSAAISTDIPLLGNPIVIMQFEGRQRLSPSQAPLANYFAVTSKYAETMGMQLVAGRFVNDQDLPSSPPVIVINQTLANRYFHGENPLGKRMEIGNNNPPAWREIVGVVADVKTSGLDQDTPVQVYLPYMQRPSVFGTPAAITVLAKVTQSPGVFGEILKNTVSNVDHSQPVYSVLPMTAIVSQSIAQRRFSLVLLAFFSVTALFLAALGLYGVMSYIVVQRTAEIGIRIALGARYQHVMMLVQRQGTILVMAGIGAGLVIALLLTRLMRSLLFQVNPSDPITFLVVTGTLLAVSGLACYLPARRATRVDPMVALRNN
jgi:predicted permease